jgi:hypothetical protein
MKRVMLSRMRTGWLLLSCALCACSDRADGADGGGSRDSGSRDAAFDASGDGGRSDAGPPRLDAGLDAGDGGMPMCDGSMVALPYPDEVPGTDRTEPPSCPGCPTFETVGAAPSGTTVTVTGSTGGGAPTMCRWYLLSPTCGGASGEFLPDEFTGFTLRLPLFCGANRLQLVCENGSGVAISTREIPGGACVSRDLQITLSWGPTANDMELHLIRDGAFINDPVGDCTWFTCMSTSPDWGVPGDPMDDPRKDVDNLFTFGPENIYLTAAAAGTYDVMVEYWGSGTPDTSEVVITLGGVTVWRGTHTMSLYDVWHVGTLEFPAATFTPVDTIIPCAAMWRTGGSFGCALMIP